MLIKPYFVVFAALVLTVPSACDKSKPTEKPDVTPDKIAIPNPKDGVARSGLFTFLESSFPATIENFTTARNNELKNGYLKTKIRVPSSAPAFPGGRPPDAKARDAFARTQEATALKSGFFSGDVGFRWEMDPASPVVVTVSFAGKIQSILKTPSTVDQDSSKFGQTFTKGTLAVSLAQFSEVWPPTFTGRYEIKLTNTSSAPQAFSHSLSFTADVPSSLNARLVVTRHTIDGRTFAFAEDITGVKLVTIAPNAECDGCTVSFQGVQASQRTSLITELPALPDNSARGFTWPARFSGLLARGRTCETQAVVIEEGLAKTLAFHLKGTCTQVTPWCVKNGTKNTLAGSSCPVSGLSGPAATRSSFAFLNAVPEAASLKLMGHVDGVLDTSIFACMKVVLTKRGETISDSFECFDSGPAHAVDSPALPDFAQLMLKQASFSNAPMFND